MAYFFLSSKKIFLVEEHWFASYVNKWIMEIWSVFARHTIHNPIPIGPLYFIESQI